MHRRVHACGISASCACPDNSFKPHPFLWPPAFVPAGTPTTKSLPTPTRLHSCLTWASTRSMAVSASSLCSQGSKHTARRDPGLHNCSTSGACSANVKNAFSESDCCSLSNGVPHSAAHRGTVPHPSGDVAVEMQCLGMQCWPWVCCVGNCSLQAFLSSNPSRAACTLGDAYIILLNKHIPTPILLRLAGAFHGVPIVAFPFTSEQLDNAIKGQARGFAVMCKEAPVFAPRDKPHCEGVGDEGSGGACVCVRSQGVVEGINEVGTTGRV